MRLYPLEGHNRFHVEALEAELGRVELSNTHKTNAASRSAHAAAGFVRARDWWEEDGARDGRQVTLIYTPPAAQHRKEFEPYGISSGIYAPGGPGAGLSAAGAGLPRR